MEQLYFIMINAICFVVMMMDKYKAVHHKWRIAERTLFVLAALGGASGGILAMFLFHHKTKKMKFLLGFPILAVVHWIIIGKLLLKF